MKIELKRTALKEYYTIGHLYVNGEYICDTIEDKVRDINKNGVFDGAEKKVPSETAIPYGQYTVTLDVISPKFSKKPFYVKNCDGGRVPRLLNVKHFDGILIHCGTSEKSSAGCIIVGYNKIVGRVVESESAFLKLYSLMKEAKKRGENIIIEIV